MVKLCCTIYKDECDACGNEVEERIHPLCGVKKVRWNEFVQNVWTPIKGMWYSLPTLGQVPYIFGGELFVD